MYYIEILILLQFSVHIYSSIARMGRQHGSQGKISEVYVLQINVAIATVLK
jgi:hypothetical protein